MLAIGCDKAGKSELSILEYAKDIFDALNVYLVAEGRAIVRKDPAKSSNLEYINASDKFVAELAMQEQFRADQEDWPNARWDTFIQLLFQKAKLQFRNDTY